MAKGFATCLWHLLHRQNHVHKVTPVWLFVLDKRVSGTVLDARLNFSRVHQFSILKVMIQTFPVSISFQSQGYDPNFSRVDQFPVSRLWSKLFQCPSVSSLKAMIHFPARSCDYYMYDELQTVTSPLCVSSCYVGFKLVPFSADSDQTQSFW